MKGLSFFGLPGLHRVGNYIRNIYIYINEEAEKVLPQFAIALARVN